LVFFPLPNSLRVLINLHCLSWASGVFFGIWADFQPRESLVELHARIVEGHLQLMPTPGSPVRVQDNRIWLEDGRELVLQLETVS